MYIKAKTKANEKLLNYIMSFGENCYENSKYLNSKIYNPIYKMISDAGLDYGLKSTVISNRYLVVEDLKGNLIDFSPNTPNLSLATRRIVNDKNLTKIMLSKRNIPVPEGHVFTELRHAISFFKNKKKVVIKPKVGSGGKGVTASIETLEEFKLAWKKAKLSSKEIIVEGHVEGDELRVFVLGGKVVAAICRIPAYVIGDGKHTIQELIQIKNKKRVLNPSTKKYPIQVNLDIDTNKIPAVKEFVLLSSVSNIGLGGESVNLIEYLHPSIIKLAESVWNAIPHATQLGLDIIANNFTENASNNAYVIEVNADPAVATPVFTMYGNTMFHLPNLILNYSLKLLEDNKKQNSNRNSKVAENSKNIVSEVFPKNTFDLQVYLLRRAAYEKGLDVEKLSNSITAVKSSTNDKEIYFVNGMCGETLFSTPLTTTNKQRTKDLLSKKSISVPTGKTFSFDSFDSAWSFAKNILPVVLKPLSGSGGKDVFLSINNEENFKYYWDLLAENGVKKIVCERYFVGKEVRLIVVGDKIISATKRKPAFIVGDGKSTISRLIELKNHSRLACPYLSLNLIKMTPDRVQNLKEAGLTDETILDYGQEYQFSGISNIGSGGENYDVTNIVHSDWNRIAYEVRNALYDAVHVGIDLLVEDISIAPEAQVWNILEVNSNPEFALQFFPVDGDSRDVARSILDYLFD
ncbi:hypothetical protein AKN88_05015 [Thiopseudomonas alkaliphila]|uniref:ATP-grasp domain-containing protein n=1 Tax=Thiopseudomonas alkaliphila TaxID=1697053 RepID=A0A0K1XDV5_9GAMM|nr:ATP-grasp domain-containing protein [Thiopseudomonas alkaliphila]AKX59368.1 hypothetical protein AKN88_05015 [Thiopseudomonas alkaliphila]